MYHIREVRPDDYPAVSAICTAIRNEPMSAEELADEDRRAHGVAGGFLRRLVAEDASGRVVGYATVNHFPWFPEAMWELYVAVHPDCRRQGAGQALYKVVEAIALDHGAVTGLGWCRSIYQDAYEWTQRRGWECDLLRTESVLDLTTFDMSRFAGVLEAVRAGGIRLETYRSVTMPDAVLRGYYDMEKATAPDVPDYDPDERVPDYAEYARQWRAYTAPRVTVVALDGDRVAGASDLFLPAYPGKGAYTGYTGTLREYRGRHIALACKLLTVEAAIKHGAPRMRTNNDFENPAMLAVNTRLGYQMVPGPRRLKKRFRD